ncbi:MAG: 4-hydroxy-tetrahydrodipicolinate reductase [Deltaproteobacteria bacterium]|nr:4-hydroxy-tetrahydrodipicolinate reductase [Deltaproteobacteria bacterium]
MIPIVVSGARGRLGQRIRRLVEAASDLSLAGCLVRPGTEDGERMTSDPSVITAGTVLIETGPPAVAERHAEHAAAVGAAVLMATTGFERGADARFDALADRCPFLLAPNLSLGIAVLEDLVRRASAVLGEYDVEIVEAHHRKKVDAPSGTAWALARAASLARDGDIERDAILARAGTTGPRSATEIGMQSIRGGDVVGEHTVYFLGLADRIELTHRAQDRDVFAHGAVRAARFLGAPGRSPGRYTMRNVLGLDPA